VVLQPLVTAVAGGYRAGQIRMALARVMGSVVAVAIIALLHMQLTQTGATASYGVLGLLSYLFWGSLLLFLGRIALEDSVRRAFRHGLGNRNVLVVGSSRESARLMMRLHGRDAEDVRIVGRISTPRRRQLDPRGVVDEVLVAVESSGASEVIVASPGFSLDLVEELVERCLERGVSVSVMHKKLGAIDARIELRRTSAGPLLRLQPAIGVLTRDLLKRGMDVSLSMIGLLLIWPLLLVIAVAIKLDSRGPVLFRQLRAGKDGKPFMMYKFRTMVCDADEMKAELLHLNVSGDPRLFKIRQDPRVTRTGRVLRATSLDELPQLLNVLVGEMSLIGPRPFFPDDLEQYEEHHFGRLSVLPGITGLWQVNGRSEIVDFEDVIRWDQQYVQQWSLWMDLKILVMTLPAVLRRTGAY